MRIATPKRPTTRLPSYAAIESALVDAIHLADVPEGVTLKLTRAEPPHPRCRCAVVQIDTGTTNNQR